MIISIKEVLEKILLPVSSGWSFDKVEVNENDKEIHVFVRYNLEIIELKNESFPVHDFRSERCWRHLDLWEYKTVIKARIPRYKDAKGKVISTDVPWADSHERMSVLLEKKR